MLLCKSTNGPASSPHRRLIVCFRTYKSVGEPLSGWFSAKPFFDDMAEQTHEAYLA